MFLKYTTYRPQIENSMYNAGCISLNLFSNQSDVKLLSSSSSSIHHDFISIIQLIINIIGVIGNILLIALLRTHALGGRLPTILFKSQATFDMLVNIHAVYFSLNGELWNVHIDWLNLLICRLWHSQFIFWFFVQLSIGNLVLIGFERYIALSFPINYQKLQPSHIAFYSIIFNLIYNFFMASPNILETTIKNGCCHSQHFDQFIHHIIGIYSVTWFILIYLLAFILLIYFYGGVIIALRKSILITQAQHRSLATMRFTRMAIVITVVYMLCISYDAFAYLIGRAGTGSYEYNTIWHKLGMLFVSINSFANPFIYYLFVLNDSCRKKFKTFYKNRHNLHVFPRSQSSHRTNVVRGQLSSTISQK